MVDKKQLLIASLLLALIASFFWTQSRMPALDQKAQMGQRTAISSIAFDIALPVNSNQHYFERVFRSAINWGYTNWKGMTFGLVFAAAFITFIRLLPTFGDSRFKFINAFKGMVIGVPLGVCANCSTPIAHGMVRAGTRLETALATLMSSPTLNIFVLTMTFSLLPFHVALAKVLGVIIVVLIGVPLLIKLLGNTIDASKPLVMSNYQKTPLKLTADNCEIPAHTWFEASHRIQRKFLTNLNLVMRETLPLMLLAGILGALAIESIPTTSLSSLESSVLTIIAISLIGAFLPVPIAFDVIVVVTLLTTGLSVDLGASLLFSLGIFSIYPAIVIAKQISVKLSAALFSLVVLMSTAVGVAAGMLDETLIVKSTTDITNQLSLVNENNRSLELAERECKKTSNSQQTNQCIDNVLKLIESKAPKADLNLDTRSCEKLKEAESYTCMANITMNFAVKTGDISNCQIIPMPDIKALCEQRIIANKIKALLEFEAIKLKKIPAESEYRTSTHNKVKNTLKVHSKPLVANWNKIHDDGTIALESKPLLVQPGSANGFSKESAEDIGLSLPFDFNYSDFFEPFKYGRGVASGDFNKDGAPDLVFATSYGPVIFINNGDGQFHKISNAFSDLTNLSTFVVAFVDINNDSWQDLFFTTYGGKSFIVPNSQGQFIPEQIREINGGNTSVTLAVGFYDKHHDGDLDFLLGNWTAGAENQFNTTYSANTWVTTEAGQFQTTQDSSTAGETLSILFSDLNNDNHLDLVVANDNQGPDIYYYGDDEWNFSSISPDQEIIPATSLTTMSVESADFNNDLLLDIFTTDMSFGEGETQDYCGLISTPGHQSACYRALASWKDIKSLNTSTCQKQAVNKLDCLNASLLQLAKTSKDPSLCDRLNASQTALKLLCSRLATKMPSNHVNLANHIPQQQANKLLINQDSTFRDASKAFQIDNSYWSWNSKSADLDNDGWLDILVANGFGFGEQQNEIHSNIFFRNINGTHFERKTDQFGLKQLLNTPSYTYVDLDQDGDLDIVSAAIMANPQIHINQSANNRIVIEPIDHIKNHYCIGCKVIIKDDNGLNQMREIKLSGGYMSFDNPLAYFGLGKARQIEHVKIIWSDGKVTQLDTHLRSNHHFRITRKH